MNGNCATGGTLGVGCCGTLAGLELAEVAPAPVVGYVVGFLTAWAIEIPALPRTLFHAPPTAPFRSGRSLRWLTAVVVFLALDVDHGYLYGILAGHLLLVFQMHGRTRLRLAGALFQILVPVLLVAVAIRMLSVSGKATEDPGAWLLPMSISLPMAGIFWAAPYGKRLSWRGSWSPRFPYPRATPAESSPTEEARQGPRYSLLPGQDPRRGMAMWLAGWPCCLVALGLSFWGVHRLLTTSPSLTSSFFFVLAMVGVGAFDRSRKLFLMGRRHLKLAIASPDVLYPGSYVLYLRSFEDDEERAALQEQFTRPGEDGFGGLVGLVISSRDEEEHIADAFRPVGPLVAVGAPGLPPFAGAVRMSLPETSWRQSVGQLMRRARLVTLTLGSSAGTMWELAEAMRTLPPQRLLLMVPGTMDAEEYEAIRASNDRTLRELPESARNTTWKGEAPPSLPDHHEPARAEPLIGFIHFSADWEPTFTPLSHGAQLPGRNLFTRLVHGLGPVFDRLAAYEERTGRHCG
jgi:hypothetical protein